MATDKQLAANRANAKRSTGPKSIAGKSRSSRNSFRHGLSLPPSDSAVAEAIELVKSIAAINGSEMNNQSAQFSCGVAQAQLRQVRRIQDQLLAMPDILSDARLLRAILSTERYERRAFAKRRKAAKSL